MGLNKNILNEKSFLLHEDFIDFMKDRMGKDQFIAVYKRHDDFRDNVCIVPALIPNEIITRILDFDVWDISSSFGTPHCYTTYEDDCEKVIYTRFGDVQGIEPLVYRRNYDGIKEPNIEITDEFRLIFNLFFDSTRNIYVRINDAGDDETVIKASDSEIKIRSKELKSFLTVKDMDLVLYFDNCRFSNHSIDEFDFKNTRISDKSDNYIYSLIIRKLGYKEKIFSRLCGKKIIHAYDKKKCCISPYSDNIEAKYEEFIVGLSEEDEEILISCNPNNLPSPMFMESQGPHFLMPVYFRKEVLAKYYNQPTKYTVKDGYLSCGGLWGLSMDNDHEDFVIVYIGDLGEKLPHTEQLYWKPFNYYDKEPLSVAAFQRDFMAEFADPEADDHIFKQKYKEFIHTWRTKYNWDLFSVLSDKDSYHYNVIRIPLTQEQSEFDDIVQSISTILIESINDKQLKKELQGEDLSEIKSIGKLELFLNKRGAPGTEKHIGFLRDLWDLRSSGSSHKKGKKYDKVINNFETSSNDLKGIISEILKKSSALLDYLSAQFLCDNP